MNKLLATLIAGVFAAVSTAAVAQTATPAPAPAPAPSMGEKAKEKVETLLLEGLQSEASEMTREDWDELKRRVRERQGKRNPPENFCA